MRLFGQFMGGVMGGLVGAATWAGIVHFTGYEVGFVAWFIGVMVGAGVGMAASSGRAQGSGLLAGLIALGAIGVGKVSVVWLQMQEYRVESLSEDAMVAKVADAALAERMDAGEDFSSWFESIDEKTLDSRQAWFPPEVWSGAERRWYAMTDAERDEARAGVEAELTSYAPAALVIGSLMSLGLFDLLWVGLAVSSAYKIASTAGPRREFDGVRYDHRVMGEHEASAPSSDPGQQASGPAPAPRPLSAAAGGLSDASHPMLRMGMNAASATPNAKPMRKLSDPSPTPEEELGLGEAPGHSEAA